MNLPSRPFTETPFELAVDGGSIHGHFGGTGVPALLLHGGPGVNDYMGGCAAELANLFTNIRYTQRGVEPSTAAGPYTIETHMADAIAILDLFEQGKAWAVGHSWGGHLALHLAVTYPERLYGVVCIDPLAATDDRAQFAEALRRDLDGEQLARLAEISEHHDDGSVTEEELLEEIQILWPSYFYDRSKAPPCLIEHRGVEATLETNRSIDEHFAARTLKKGVGRIDLPVLFVHGIEDPLPLSGSVQTANHIKGARVARIPRCGHLPWIEQPGFVNRSLRGLISLL